MMAVQGIADIDFGRIQKGDQIRAGSGKRTLLRLTVAVASSTIRALRAAPSNAFRLPPVNWRVTAEGHGDSAVARTHRKALAYC